MRYFSVCSGIEAATVGWHRMGWEPVAFSEIEPFPAAVLKHHYPNVPNLGDMTKIDGREYRGLVDVLVGGTPCQAFSVAGLRRGLIDPRGNLTLVFAKLADDMAVPFTLWENVPGVLSSKDNAFGCFLGLLAGEADALTAPGGKWTDAGFVLGPQRSVAWRVLDAQYFGLAQRRRRVFVVACPRGGADPREILFEREGLRRDTAPSREAGEVITPTVRAGASNGGPSHGARSGDSKDELIVPVCFGGNNTSGPIDVATARNASGTASGRMDFETETFAVTTLAIRGRGDSSNLEIREDGTANALLTPNGGRGGIGVGAVAFPWQSALDPIGKPENVSGTLIKNQIMGCMDTAMHVRRLTPRECERLQGFPDDYTLIPWKNKPAEVCPDGPRYKALGNSMAVPCMRWIGRRIELYGKS